MVVHILLIMGNWTNVLSFPHVVLGRTHALTFIYVPYFIIEKFLLAPNSEVLQITSKCNKLKTNVTCFAAIYNKLFVSRSSDSSDVDILTLTNKRYREEYRSAFVHEHCWSIIKHNLKWSAVPPDDDVNGFISGYKMRQNFRRLGCPF